jgi:hypothetical protein
MHPHQIILPFLVVLSAWFVVFFSPLVPHLVGWRKKVRWMTRKQMWSMIVHPRLYFLDHCQKCQSVWSAVLLSLWLGIDHGAVGVLHGVAAIVPYYVLITLLTGKGEEVTPPTPPARPYVATSEEREVLKFFGTGPCWFEGCAELRARYAAEKEELGASCSNCELGELNAKYMDEVGKLLGYAELPIVRQRRQRAASGRQPAARP